MCAARARARLRAGGALRRPSGESPRLSIASERASEPPTFAALNAAAATVGRRERLVHRSVSGGGSAPAKRRARERVGESEGRNPSDELSRGAPHVLGAGTFRTLADVEFDAVTLA